MLGISPFCLRQPWDVPNKASCTAPLSVVLERAAGTSRDLDLRHHKIGVHEWSSLKNSSLIKFRVSFPLPKSERCLIRLTF